MYVWVFKKEWKRKDSPHSTNIGVLMFGVSTAILFLMSL